MRRQGSDDWRGSLDALGQRIVERLGGRWTPGGGMCRCPAHDDRTPSLSVRPGNRRLLFHCFAGCDTDRVIRELRYRRLIEAEPPYSLRRGSSRSRQDQGNRAVARRLWAEAGPLRGSPAEAYLAARALTLAATDLRYHPRTPCGRRAEAIFRPALLSAVRDDTGLVAVHRTFLDIHSSNISAMAVAKRALGPLGAGAVRLFPPAAGVLGWAEGIESALAATMLTGIGCWATLGNERFARVMLPAGVRRLVLFLDADAAGRRAERLALGALRGTGVEVEVRRAWPPGADWNDMLVSARRHLR